MVQPRPPNADDLTGENDALEFDGTDTDQLDDTYRFRLVASSENLTGGIGFDERGRAQWKWVTELGGIDDSGTFEQLKALENPALSLEETPAPTPPQPASKTGYDPYATGVFEKPKPAVKRAGLRSVR